MNDYLPATDRSTSVTHVVRRAWPLLGTLVDIAIQGRGKPRQLQRAIDGAFGCVAQVHSLMAYQDPYSELSRINRLAAQSAQRIHPHTRTVLAAALRLAAQSEGAFDPSVAPVLELGGLLPSHREADGGTEGSWRDIELGDDSVRFHRTLRVDLGGIAKGYAVDLAVAWLRERVDGTVVVNAGGDLRVAGGSHQVQLREPLSGRPGAHVLNLTDQALATSAPQPAGDLGQTSSARHLVDPHRREPYRGAASVSVVAADCLSADALTKVVLFAPPGLAEQVLRAHGARAVVQSGEAMP